ncbi:MAG TPA: nicotinate (nicotinamide) nucleotide adenylyltransferase [Terracidiphilus sp.]|nr:nicotinate (nicotinamide) nucleotide adenylyltransferase [Terracidiphilus sp.]
MPPTPSGDLSAAPPAGPSGAPRVAFFGGSFDPPHLGHLAIARAARAALQLDRILFAPVAAQPLKPQGSSASFRERVSMTRLAIAGEPAFELSLLDAPTADAPEAPRYTIGTLAHLRAQLPAAAQLFCLIGADSFLTLRRWHRAAEVPFAAALIVAARPGQSLHDLATALPADLALAPNPAADASSPVELRAFTLRNAAGLTAPLYLLPGLHFDLSASQIRRALYAGQPDSGALLPAAVSHYIAEHHLYR